jgi:hypothetical protein
MPIITLDWIFSTRYRESLKHMQRASDKSLKSLVYRKVEPQRLLLGMLELSIAPYRDRVSSSRKSPCDIESSEHQATSWPARCEVITRMIQFCLAWLTICLRLVNKPAGPRDLLAFAYASDE